MILHFPSPFYKHNHSTHSLTSSSMGPSHRGRKSWTDSDEQEFLTSRLTEYIKCQPTKSYDNFWVDMFHSFFDKWPERERTDNCIPVEGDLTEDQRAALTNAI